MSFRFDIKPGLDLLYLRGAGTVTGRQVLRSLRVYADAPAFHPEIDTLFDPAADATVEPGDDAIMDAVAETAQEAFRFAGVVRNSDHRTLFQTATAMLAPTAQVRPFSQLPKALSWLGHGKSDLPPLDLKSGAPEPSFLPLSPLLPLRSWTSPPPPPPLQTTPMRTCSSSERGWPGWPARAS